jgi:hypothetical protein
MLLYSLLEPVCSLNLLRAPADFNQRDSCQLPEFADQFAEMT